MTESDWKVAARDSCIRQSRVAPARQSEQRHQHREDGAAHREQIVDRPAGQIGDRVEVEIVDPHSGQSDHRQPDAPAAVGRGLAVEIVDQHQRAGGDGEADDLAGRDQRVVRRSASSANWASTPAMVSWSPITAGDDRIDELHRALAPSLLGAPRRSRT